jgi:hypothetical protein
MNIGGAVGSIRATPTKAIICERSRDRLPFRDVEIGTSSSRPRDKSSVSLLRTGDPSTAGQRGPTGLSGAKDHCRSACCQSCSQSAHAAPRIRLTRFLRGVSGTSEFPADGGVAGTSGLISGRVGWDLAALARMG